MRARVAVADVMRKLGSQAGQPRAYKRITAPGEQPVASPDLIGREFTADAPGTTRLVGDITYLRTGEGWLYLATVIDLATRMVVGWQTADHMRTGLVIDALAMANRHGHVHPDAVFHLDRGCRAAHLSRVRSLLHRQPGPHQRRAYRRVLGQRRRRIARARFAVAEYIELFHNRQRLHSGLGYRMQMKPLPSTHFVPQPDQLNHQDLSKILDAPQL